MSSYMMESEYIDYLHFCMMSNIRNMMPNERKSTMINTMLVIVSVRTRHDDLRFHTFGFLQTRK